MKDFRRRERNQPNSPALVAALRWLTIVAVEALLHFRNKASRHFWFG